MTMDSPEATFTLIKSISEFGVLAAFAGVLLWDKLRYSKVLGNLLLQFKEINMQQTIALKSIETSNQTIATAVSVLKELVTKEMSELKDHYAQTNYINKDVKETAEICRIIKERISRNG